MGLTCSVIVASLFTPSGRTFHPGPDAFFVVTAVVLGAAIVPLKAGRLSLLAIPLFTATLTISPWETALVGICGNIERAYKSRSRLPIWATISASSFWGVIGAALHQDLLSLHAPILVVVVMPVLVTTAVNVATTLTATAVLNRASLREVISTTLNRTFALAYLYFAVSALLAASLFDGSTIGWLRTAAFFLLSFAVVQAVSGRITEERLREQLLVIDERIVFGQEAEAALHAVKNQVALASQYLEELDPAQLGRAGQEALRIVFNSMQQSSDILRRTSAAGRLANAPAFVDANLVELAHSVVVLAQARASQLEIRVKLVTTERSVPVYVDPFLVREVLTNLISNSIEAIGERGRIDVLVGVRADQMPFAQVADDGPGLSDDAKRTLFESRTTTKPTSGAGIGLTLSMAIATQHGGRLTYDKRRRKGASFTLILPPRDVARAKLAPQSKMASEAQQTGLPHPEVALLPGS